MRFVCDFHIHSKYSRATSGDMDLEHLAQWAKIKGIDLLGTGDFTHPSWSSELKEKLEYFEHGLFVRDGVYFMLTAEVSNIYFKAGRTRKIHNLIFAPDFKTVSEINKALEAFGSLHADGRPILHLDSKELVSIVSGINPEAFVVPGHIWTPHFSLFGSNSGFDRLEDCFEGESGKIYALETGLSSDPAMNWRMSALDRFALISNSDSHSPSKIGREANVFSGRFGYKEFIDILRKKDKKKFLFTIEFFPEEGKYHWDGHRQCQTRLSPEESKRLNNTCPKCSRKITVGVMHRVESLADRPEGFDLESAVPFKRMIPLAEIIVDAMDAGVETVSVQREYNALISKFGKEFDILLDIPEDKLLEGCPSKVAEGIMNTRNGNVEVLPGYDGEYGKIKIFEEKEREDFNSQKSLF